MKYGYHDSKNQLLKRLSRAEGQIRGISKMVSEDKYCIDIITQINAAQAALDRVALELLREHAKHCLSDSAVNTRDGNDKVDELITAVQRMIKN